MPDGQALIEQPEDWSGLWQAIGPRGHWPTGNEIQMRDLGQALTNAGIEFGGAGGTLRTTAEADAAWPDSAGKAFRGKAAEFAATALSTEEELKRLGWSATEYGQDIVHAKKSITELVAKNANLYNSMRTMFGFPDTEQRQQFAARLGARISAFLDQMASRILARGTGGAPGPLPVLKPDSPADGIDRTHGIVFHVYGSLFGRGGTVAAGVANVDGKWTFIESDGTYVTSELMPSASATVGAYDSNATEPDQLTQTTGSVGGSVAPGTFGTPGGKVTVGPVVAEDESWGRDSDGDLIRVHEPQIGVGTGLSGPRVPAPVAGKPPREIWPGEVHESWTTTRVWSP
ncbi:hypothetical protein [Amycolatopsis sp. WGS_07]|uniref:WXG100-like domain-containing protein n=1 Tax=Amycolatopsis sp. WGS_07 TaxID=3076764 RepID=UPI003873AA9E